MRPGTVLTTPGGTLYEYVHDGCADPNYSCHRTAPITVIPLTKDGKRRFGGLTVCMEADNLSEAEGWT